MWQAHHRPGRCSAACARRWHYWQSRRGDGIIGSRGASDGTSWRRVVMALGAWRWRCCRCAALLSASSVGRHDVRGVRGAAMQQRPILRRGAAATTWPCTWLSLAARYDNVIAEIPARAAHYHYALAGRTTSSGGWTDPCSMVALLAAGSATREACVPPPPVQLNTDDRRSGIRMLPRKYPRHRRSQVRYLSRA